MAMPQSSGLQRMRGFIAGTKKSTREVYRLIAIAQSPGTGGLPTA